MCNVCVHVWCSSSRLPCRCDVHSLYSILFLCSQHTTSFGDISVESAYKYLCCWYKCTMLWVELKEIYAAADVPSSALHHLKNENKKLIHAEKGFTWKTLCWDDKIFPKVESSTFNWLISYGNGMTLIHIRQSTVPCFVPFGTCLFIKIIVNSSWVNWFEAGYRNSYKIAASGRWRLFSLVSQLPKWWFNNLYI